MPERGAVFAERGVHVAAALVGFALLAVPVLVCGLGARSLPAAVSSGWIVPALGSAAVALGAVVWAGPVGIGAATWLGWVAPVRWRTRGRHAVAALAGIPTVVLGFAGLVAVAPLLEGLPGVSDGRGWLAASVVVGVYALPAIVATADRAMRGVPAARMDAAMALGATRVQVIRQLVWPACRGSLAAAALLGVVRALGDTMIVLLLAGDPGSRSLLGPLATLTATLARGLPGAGEPERAGLYLAALALVVASVALGALARRLEAVDGE